MTGIGRYVAWFVQSSRRGKVINLRVVDIYHEDKVTSFQKAAEAGLWGVIHKATTGASGKDDKYSARRKAALDAGLLWGAYHWGTKANVAAQVDHFLQYANPDRSTLVALDFERSGDNTMTLDQAREFLQLIDQKLRAHQSRIGRPQGPFLWRASLMVGALQRASQSAEELGEILALAIC
jgi:GH25 family lysozyme M1 (1,4-beta-N-acetylmuramidase)